MVRYASLEGSRRASENTAKKLEKKFKKPIDKWEKLWYDSKAVPLRGERERTLKTEQQRVQSKRLYTYVSQDIYGTR